MDDGGIARYPLDPHRVVDDLPFEPDECYHVATGTCSLEGRSATKSGQGRGSYDHCRRLAVWAQLWLLLRQHFGGTIPVDDRDACTRPEVINALKALWKSPYGAPEHWESEIQRAFGLYEGVQECAWDFPITAAVNPDGSVELNDGRHRCCVARRLGFRPGALAYLLEPDAP